MLSLHEGPQDAAFMFANRHVDGALARRLLAALEAGGHDAGHEGLLRAAAAPAGLSASTPGRSAGSSALWEATLKMRAVNEYAAARGVPEITLESSWRSTDRAARVRAHVDLALALRDELAQVAT